MQSFKKKSNMQLKLETRAVMQITHVEMCDIIAVQYIWNKKSCLWDPSTRLGMNVLIFSPKLNSGYKIVLEKETVISK